MTDLLKMYDEKINPKPVAVSDEDIASARFNLYQKELNSLVEYIDFLEKVISGEIKGNKIVTKEYCEKLIVGYRKNLEKIESQKKSLQPNQKIENVVISDSLMRFYILSLSSPHCGDCTQVPTGCERCDAESVFGLKYTKTWTSREGREMSDALIKAGMFNFNSAECQMEDEI